MIVVSALFMAVSLRSDEVEVKVIAGVLGTAFFMAALACAPKPPKE